MRKVKDIIFRSLPQVLLLGFSMLTVGCGKEVNDFLGLTREVEATLPSLTVAEAVRVEPMGSRSVGTSAAEAGNDLFSVSVGLPQDASSADASGAQAAVSARSNAGAAAFPATRASVPLSNVWVFQFDTQGALATCAYVGTVAAGKRVTATLQSGDGYTVWIMANGPVASANLGEQITDIRDFELALHKWGDPTTDDQIALTGKLTDVRVLDNGQVLVGDDITVVPEIELTRAMARVDLLLEYDVSGAELDGVWLYNVPQGTCYGLDPSSTDFPSSATSSDFAYTDGEGKGLSPISAGSGTVTHTWYMGDNRRGTNDAISWEKNKGAVNAPAMATYARIVSHETADESFLIYHDVYLGQNLTTDFNVLRNRHYTYRVRIGGTLDEQKLLATKDDRVTAEHRLRIDKVSISPDPSAGVYAGDEFTITVKGYWEEPLPLQLCISNSEYDMGSVVYNREQEGGSKSLTVPGLTGNTGTYSVQFQYLWQSNWITFCTAPMKVRDLTEVGDDEIVVWINPKDSSDMRVAKRGAIKYENYMRRWWPQNESLYDFSWEKLSGSTTALDGYENNLIVLQHMIKNKNTIAGNSTMWDYCWRYNKSYNTGDLIWYVPSYNETMQCVIYIRDNILVNRVFSLKSLVGGHVTSTITDSYTQQGTHKFTSYLVGEELNDISDHKWVKQYKFTLPCGTEPETYRVMYGGYYTNVSEGILNYEPFCIRKTKY